MYRSGALRADEPEVLSEQLGEDLGGDERAEAWDDFKQAHERGVLDYLYSPGETGMPFTRTGTRGSWCLMKGSIEWSAVSFENPRKNNSRGFGATLTRDRR